MDKDAIDKVCKNVYQRFPAFKNRPPQVLKHGGNRYLLIFSGAGKTQDGRTISQKIRVVADEGGSIIKTSMSR